MELLYGSLIIGQKQQHLCYPELLQLGLSKNENVLELMLSTIVSTFWSYIDASCRVPTTTVVVSPVVVAVVTVVTQEFAQVRVTSSVTLILG